MKHHWDMFNRKYAMKSKVKAGIDLKNILGKRMGYVQ